MPKIYRRYRPIRGLGDASTPSGVSTTQSALTLVSNVQDKAGAKPTNTTLNEVSAVAASIGTVALAIPPPYGEVIAAVAGIVAVSAKVLSGVFGNGAAIDAQIQAIRNDNDNILAQIQTIDTQTLNVTNAMTQLNQALQAGGFKTVPLSGLGSDLEDEQALNTDLKTQLGDKGKQLQTLLDTYTTTMNQVTNAIQLRELGKKIILLGFGTLALIGLTWYLVRDIENKEK